jgi:hypothetical protein
VSVNKGVGTQRKKGGFLRMSELFLTLGRYTGTIDCGSSSTVVSPAASPAVAWLQSTCVVILSVSSLGQKIDK